MTDPRDKDFFDCADEFIRLANKQGGSLQREQVSASFSYAAARYNVFVSACKADSAQQLQERKEMVVEYFLKEYRLALEENLDEYVRSFSSYFSDRR